MPQSKSQWEFFVPPQYVHKYLPQWPCGGSLCALSTDNRTVRRAVWCCSDRCDLKLWHIRLQAKKLLPPLHWAHSASAQFQRWETEPDRFPNIIMVVNSEDFALYVISQNKQSSDTISHFLVVLINQQHLLLLHSFVWSVHSFKGVANRPSLLHINLWQKQTLHLTTCIYLFFAATCFKDLRMHIWRISNPELLISFQNG